MVVDPEITLAFHCQRHPSVLGQSGVHLGSLEIRLDARRSAEGAVRDQGSQSGGYFDDLFDIGSGGAIEVDVDLNLCLVGLSGDGCLPGRHGRWMQRKIGGPTAPNNTSAQFGRI